MLTPGDADRAGRGLLAADDGSDSRLELVEELREATARATLTEVLERRLGEAPALAVAIAVGEGHERRLGAALALTAKLVGREAGIEAQPLALRGQPRALALVARKEASEQPRLALGLGHADGDAIALGRAFAGLLQAHATRGSA